MTSQPDMQGKLCLISGATNGIGLATARALAGMGATTVIIGRNAEKTRQVVDGIKAATGNAHVEALVADLSLMAEVRRVADEFQQRHSHLHVLVNNAGSVFGKRQMTAEGFELTFALNHLSYFLLTHLLLDTLKASGTPEQRARVISVSSDAHRPQKLNFADLQSEKGYFSFSVYGRSKLMNVMFAYELARRLKAENAPVTSNAIHPGFVQTGFGKNNDWLMRAVIGGVLRPFSKSPEKGADTIIYLASSHEVEGVSGRYFEKRRSVASSGESYNDDAWKRLWTVSEQLVGIEQAV